MLEAQSFFVIFSVENPSPLFPLSPNLSGFFLSLSRLNILSSKKWYLNKQNREIE